jgi:hypothetical protein
MTARDLIDAAGRHPALLASLSLLPPLGALLLGWLHGRGGGARAPWRHLYGVLVYVACVPGIGAAVLTAYTLFFTRESLLVYVVPVVSMGVTLPLIRRNVSFDDVPGFDRLSGLMVLIALTFAVVLAIRKTFIGILFGASLTTLLAIGAGVFALLKWGAYSAFRRRDQPRVRPPALR